MQSCDSCDEEIYFRKRYDGVTIPMDRNGQHFCKGRRRRGSVPRRVPSATTTMATTAAVAKPVATSKRYYSSPMYGQTPRFNLGKVVFLAGCSLLLLLFALAWLISEIVERVSEAIFG